MAEVRAHRSSKEPPPTGAATDLFTWVFVLLCIWLMGGAYLDAWHHHNLTGTDNNFFTPYHYLLYSGIAVIGLFLGLNVLRNFRRYGTWDRLLPDGYGVSLLGTVLFGIGGGIDFLWHQRFGIELSVAALVSPPHLLLMLSGGLIVSGPLRAAMRRGGDRASWPAVISGALTLSMFTFFLQFDQPYIDVWASGAHADPRAVGWAEQELGLLGLILYALMVSGLLVMLLRRFTLPIGSVTVTLVVNALLVSPVQNHADLAIGALLGGAACDGLLYLLRPSAARRGAFQTFMFMAPATITAVYLAVVAVIANVWWPAPILFGAVPVTGMVGWLVSFVALPGQSASARLVEATLPAPAQD